MYKKNFYFVFGKDESARVHIKAFNKLIAKYEVDTSFGDCWRYSYLLEDNYEYE